MRAFRLEVWVFGGGGMVMWVGLLRHYLLRIFRLRACAIACFLPY